MTRPGTGSNGVIGGQNTVGLALDPAIPLTTVIDLKQLRDNPTDFQARLQTRGTFDLQALLELDQQLRQLEQERSQLQARSNAIGAEVGKKIKQGTDPKAPELQALRQEASEIKTTLSQLEPQERQLKTDLDAQLLAIPNLPSPTTPIGKDETENVEIRRWGDDLKITHPVLNHWDWAEQRGLVDSQRSVKLAQSRFITLIGPIAALERALISFMLSRHSQKGYVELLPPLLVNSDSLTGTGQLPKFAEESFQCNQDDLWLIPTAEVPVTNFYRDEILPLEQLPIYHCAYTPCFRREAGSYGRDTRGLIRLHQFNKVELVKLVAPETSETEHQALVNDATAILEALELPYRVMELCTGDLGFGAQKCYDLEVWLPSANCYREISSCSNFGDFQARRAKIRYKEAGKKGTNFIHTLNGSGLAVGRTMAALLENHQQPDGSVKIPAALQPFYGQAWL